MNSPTLQFGSVERPPSGELPEDRERAIRDLLESIARETLEASAGSKRRKPAWRPRIQLARMALATATAGVLVAVSLVAADVFRSDMGVAHAATPALIGHETSAGDPASAELTALATRVATDAELDAGADSDPGADSDVGADSEGLDGATASGGGLAIRTERWSLEITESGPKAAEGDAPPEGAAPDAAPEGRADDGATASTGDAATSSNVSTAVIPIRRDLIRHANGTVSVREVGGEPQFPSEAYRRAWTEDGRPGPAGEVLRDETLEAGAWATMYPDDLPTQPAELRDVLATERPALADDSAELFRAVRDVHLEQVPDSAVRAAILRLLADAPDVESLGETTDRAGRTVQAFATDSDGSGWPIRHVLLIDRDDGRLLGYEQVLLDDVEQFDAAAPAVIDYTLFL
ncbi:hypothetical protein [Phytoactinopolyspora halotolerans]|uniref:CU044_5270 family protein n=1 Tax=Phytoactinopolyspora halotolerans TaxID=1981512 RepID=A0A6L9S984_9ACTN|nr:hypothetical protein [Phytoactinopolyspora halotolerans]NEE00530.1 hypothetical protein [Phytoactinopolyspora halotolerans]